MLFLATLPGLLTIQPGDTVTVVGWVGTVKRGAVVIWAGDLRTISVPHGGPAFAAGLQRNQLAWEGPKVAGLSLVLTKVTRNDNTGKIYVTLTEGGTEELTWEQIVAARNEVESADYLRKLVYAKMFAESPDGANLEACVGGLFSINADSDAIFVYTPPAP